MNLVKWLGSLSLCHSLCVLLFFFLSSLFASSHFAFSAESTLAGPSQLEMFFFLSQSQIVNSQVG